MRENIYIRKENEKYWKDLPDKSAWVNDGLQQSFNHELPSRRELVVETAERVYEATLPPAPKKPAPFDRSDNKPLFRDKKKNKL